MPVDANKTEFGELFISFDVYYVELSQPQKSLIKNWIPPAKSIPSESPPQIYKMIDHNPHGRPRPTTASSPFDSDSDDGPGGPGGPGNVQCQTQ